MPKMPPPEVALKKVKGAPNRRGLQLQIDEEKRAQAAADARDEGKRAQAAADEWDEDKRAQDASGEAADDDGKFPTQETEGKLKCGRGTNVLRFCFNATYAGGGTTTQCGTESWCARESTSS